MQYTEIPNDDSCDSDDGWGGGGGEPLIQEPDLDSLVSQVSPELLEHTPEHYLTPSVSVLSTEPDTYPSASASHAELDATPHIFNYTN